MHSGSVLSNEVCHTQVLLGEGLSFLRMSKEQLKDNPEYKPERVELQLELSALANARVYYAAKKKSASKQVCATDGHHCGRGIDGVID